MRKAIKDSTLVRNLVGLLGSVSVLEDFKIDISFSSKLLPIIKEKTVFVVPIRAINEEIGEQGVDEREAEFEIYVFQKSGNIDIEAMCAFLDLLQDVEATLKGETFNNDITKSHIDEIEWDAMATEEQDFLWGGMLRYVATIGGVI